MKDGKFETQKEIFEALLRGEKITFTDKIGHYVYLAEEGAIKTDDGLLCELCFSYPNDWSIYQEPKKKKTIGVKFYRYHCKRVSPYFPDHYYLSGWTSKVWEKYKNEDSIYSSLLKTEERIEIYEIDE